jgi:amino acid permease
MALGYQQVMPKVTSMLEGDKDKIITSVITGTAFPFVLFLLWNAITLGNAMSESGLLVAGVDPVALLQSQGGLLGGLVSVFSTLVVAGTLFNFSGLFVDNVEDTAQIRIGRWRPALFAGSLVPAALISASDAVNVCKLLDYAGAFSISILFLFLPSIMIWKERYGDDNSPLTVKPMVPFGKLSLSSLWKVAATLFIEQGAEKLGLIEFIKNSIFH